MPSFPEFNLMSRHAELISHLERHGLTRHLMFAVCEVGGTLCYLSDRFCAALGYGGSQTIAADFDLLRVGLQRTEAYEEMLQKAAAGEDWRGELSFRGKDNQPRWFDTTIFLQATEDEQFLYVVAADVTDRHLAENAHRQMESVLSQIVEGDPVPTFVIDRSHRVTHWNRAIALLTGIPAKQMVGTRDPSLAFYGNVRPVMADLIVEGQVDGLEAFYPGHCRRSDIVPDAFEAEAYFEHMGQDGRWLLFTAAPFRDEDGRILGAIETLLDITTRKKAEEAIRHAQAELEALVRQRTAQLEHAKCELESDVQRRERSEAELRSRNHDLLELNTRLQTAQRQLAQSERMASIGQLAAGVAHEINNPIGYVQSNLGTLETYLNDIFQVLDAFEELIEHFPADHPRASAVRKLMIERDINFLRKDLPSLMDESKEGITRVRKIVGDLKDFSRVDTSFEWQWADIHQGMESTLNIVNNEIKYKADVVREYGDLPDIECLPYQLNQVFMNLLVNAAQAMPAETHGTIRISTGFEAKSDQVWIEIRDTGTGMPSDVISRIFDPFFTTKPVGKGTGLGLSLAYGIIQRHRGVITVESVVGQGSSFKIVLPVRQTRQGDDGEQEKP